MSSLCMISGSALRIPLEKSSPLDGSAIDFAPMPTMNGCFQRETDEAREWRRASASDSIETLWNGLQLGVSILPSSPRSGSCEAAWHARTARERLSWHFGWNPMALRCLGGIVLGKVCGGGWAQTNGTNKKFNHFTDLTDMAERSCWQMFRSQIWLI